jgi:hypothetical protein
VVIVIVVAAGGWRLLVFFGRLVDVFVVVIVRPSWVELRTGHCRQLSTTTPPLWGWTTSSDNNCSFGFVGSSGRMNEGISMLGVVVAGTGTREKEPAAAVGPVWFIVVLCHFIIITFGLLLLGSCQLFFLLGT